MCVEESWCVVGATPVEVWQMSESARAYSILGKQGMFP
jgi:hypothetical protein